MSLLPIGQQADVWHDVPPEAEVHAGDIATNDTKLGSDPGP